MKAITVLGIDLAKEVFQLHGVNKEGQPVLRRQVKRRDLRSVVVNLGPCLIGMEACGSAHYWAREFASMGHTVKLMAPQFVKPYVKTNKNDMADAEAICEAVQRPSMRFVSVKQLWQQEIQSLHRVRQRWVKNRVALTNELHGLFAEYGVALSRRSLPKLIAEVSDFLEKGILSQSTRQLFLEVLGEVSELENKISICDEQLKELAKNERCKNLMTIPGVGVVTATAILGMVANMNMFKNGREFSAWLGLVPKQSSSGGKNVLLGISKRGDPYLRTLLVHGGRSVLRVAPLKKDRLSLWAVDKQKTRGTNRAIVALANKKARTIWAVMTSDKPYREFPAAA